MQKKLIALAVASLASGAAFAQTNVTIYGIVDAGYVYSWGDPGRVAGTRFDNAGANIRGTNTFSGVQSGLLAGSRIGFKGEEALGNGLKAIFTLEYALDIDGNFGVGASASGLAARQQFVGLSSAKLGTVALGRQYAPGYVASANNDAFGGALFSPQSFLTSNAGNTITPNSGARWNNAITYTSPNWGGFTGKAIYSFGENNNGGSFLSGTGTGAGVSTTDNSRYGLGFNFANGPVNVDLVYQVRQDVQTAVTAPTLAAPFPNNSTLPAVTYNASSFPDNERAFLVQGNGKDINEWYIGGSFDLKMVKLMASYQGQNDKNPANLDNQTWSVGAVIPVLSASNVHLSYAQQMWDQGSNVLGQKLLNGNSDVFAIGWTTKLSKRTTLYTGYVWANNDRNSVANGPVAGLPVTAARDEQNQTFLAGINHSF
jgi:predicted porin